MRQMNGGGVGGAGSYHPTARFGLICLVKKSLNDLRQLGV